MSVIKDKLQVHIPVPKITSIHNSKLIFLKYEIKKSSSVYV